MKDEEYNKTEDRVIEIIHGGVTAATVNLIMGEIVDKYRQGGVNAMAESKYHIMAHKSDQGGVLCPVCGQKAQDQKNDLHRVMALDLIRLYKLCCDKNDFYHLNDFVANRNGSNNFNRLRRWGFIEGDGRRGWWRITETGRKFVKEEIKVASWVMTYDGKEIGRSEDLVGIQDVLQHAFDYEKLLGRYYKAPLPSPQGKLL